MDARGLKRPIIFAGAIGEGERHPIKDKILDEAMKPVSTCVVRQLSIASEGHRRPAFSFYQEPAIVVMRDVINTTKKELGCSAHVLPASNF